jgi:sigma-54 dependent transcriptional regulator, acetoin dehydrogenase operon transcriptional activator AcoR
MEHKSAALERSGCCVSLTAVDGVVLARWVEDAEFRTALDNMNAVPGVSVSESETGTCSSTLSLELGRPSCVEGPEHCNEQWAEITSCSAPVRHPRGRQVLGTVNLTVKYAHTSPVLISWISDVALQIERAILDDAAGRERLLLETFLSAHRDSRHPVICLDDGTVISNAAAARVLAPQDQSVLWEQALRCLHQGTRDAQIVLTDGRTAQLDMACVSDGERPFGAVVKIRAGFGVRSPLVAAVDASPPAAELPGLVGRSVAWREVCRRIAATDGQSRLLVGASGVGKMAVAVAARPDKPHVLDAASPLWRSNAGWEKALREASHMRGHRIVLRHLERLEKSQLRTTGSFVGQASNFGITVDATAVTDTSSSISDAIADWFDAVVVVPELGTRLEDLSLLLDALSSKALAGTETGEPVRWLADAVQTLSRVEWSRNIHSLDNVVRRVLMDGPRRLVSARDLPADVRARAGRRNLMGLERAEANVIMAALTAANGNKQAAAASLGIARSTLYRKVRALGIDLANWNF